MEDEPQARVGADRRLAALGAFALAALAVAFAAVALAGDAWRLGVVPVCVAGAVVGGWIAATRTRPGRWVGLAIVVVAAAVFLALILTADHRGLDVVITLAIAGGSVACARHGLGFTRSALRAAPVPGTPVGPAQHPVLIMNLGSGGGKAERFSLEDRCRERGIEPVVLEPGDDLLQLARDAIARGCDVIGMAGGDGSQALVATVASESGVAHVCIPAGTRNHFAADLGLDRDDVVGALDAFGAASERTIDLAEVNGRVFVNNVSLGVYAKVVQSPDYRDAKAQTVANLLPELVGPDAEPFDLRFRDPDGVERTGAHIIQVSNNPYVLTRAEGFGYRARIDDGLLGIAAAGITDGPSGWRQWEAAEFEVASGAPVEAGVDGEALLLDPPLRFAIRPGALRVRLPHHSFGYSPAARRASSPKAAMTDLWAVALGRPVPVTT